MVCFSFVAASELAKCIQFVRQFSSMLKFTQSSEGSRSKLTISCVDVPPFSYAEVILEAFAETPGKRPAPEGSVVVWAVNGCFLKSVLDGFDPCLTLRMEFVEDSNLLVLVQREGEGTRVRVSQIGVLHDLGPQLSVEHDISVLYGIEDIEGFRWVARAAAAVGEECCNLELRSNGDGLCCLEVRTETLRVSLELGTLHRCSTSMSVGRVGCQDLCALAVLCGSVRKHCPQLCVGFGDDGVTLLKVTWSSDVLMQTATLFCLR